MTSVLPEILERLGDGIQNGILGLALVLILLVALFVLGYLFLSRA